MRAVWMILLLPPTCMGQGDRDDRVPAGRAAVETGRLLFQEACSACHGQNGAGGHGPSLAGGRRVRDLSDNQLLEAIRKGIPGTEMPPSPLPEPQLRQIAGFVRSLGAPAIETPVPGDAESGRRLFHGEGGCSRCHAIAGQGGFIGPDLTEAGAVYTLSQLRESLLEPDKRIAEGFRAVTAVTRDGRRIEGVAKNWDNYSVQILDSGGKLHLLDRAELENLELRDRSLMPGDFARRLSAEEIQDLLAFLSRQSVRRRGK